MEMGSDAKTSRLTWHNILSILQNYPKDPLSLTKVMEDNWYHEMYRWARIDCRGQ